MCLPCSYISFLNLLQGNAHSFQHPGHHLSSGNLTSCHVRHQIATAWVLDTAGVCLYHIVKFLHCNSHITKGFRGIRLSKNYLNWNEWTARAWAGISVGHKMKKEECKCCDKFGWIKSSLIQQYLYLLSNSKSLNTLTLHQLADGSCSTADSCPTCFLSRNRKNYFLQNVVIQFCNCRPHGLRSKRKLWTSIPFSFSLIWQEPCLSDSLSWYVSVGVELDGMASHNFSDNFRKKQLLKKTDFKVQLWYFTQYLTFKPWEPGICKKYNPRSHEASKE